MNSEEQSLVKLFEPIFYILLHLEAIWACEMTHAPWKNSYQPGYPPSLIRVLLFTWRNIWFLSYPMRAPEKLCCQLLTDYSNSLFVSRSGNPIFWCSQTGTTFFVGHHKFHEFPNGIYKPLLNLVCIPIVQHNFQTVPNESHCFQSGITNFMYSRTGYTEFRKKCLILNPHICFTRHLKKNWSVNS